jgi:arylsulfatase A
MIRLLIVCVLSAVFSSAPVEAAESPADLPHIVVIMVDDMGYGDPRCFNPDSKIPTPHIDSLARDGMRFTDAHAPGPLCHMSRYGLLTGRFPFRTDVNGWRKHALIEPGQTTIASLLNDQGYRTAMVGKWHLGFNENGYDQPLPGGPVDVGFDSFFGIRASTDIPPYFYISGDRAVAPPTEQIEARSTEGWTPIQGEFWRAGGIAPGLELKDVLPEFTAQAVKVIDDHSGSDSKQPLFLYLAYPAPHTPWLPAAEFQGKSGASMYGDFTVMVDSMIGRVLTALDEAKMSDDTLVIFTSDNGPVWYEHDVERFGHDSSGGLRGMKADAWECGHRMPLIARWPGTVNAESICDQTISFVDLLATFADLTGGELSAGAGPDSFSMLPLLRGRDEPIRDSLLLASGNGTMTVRKGDWKLITALGSGGFSKPSRIKPAEGDPPGQLYNLRDDLAETNNLYAKMPAKVKEMSDELSRVRDNSQSR